ncbi:MAG: hypothetical protein CR982_06045 [Candidatus Cloacimonadota bacterium]|nr:MAG: hypothetical protein CR982_06045 [Candidatus Cloacimonadota bacterium]PIE78081.1 MAG: hypothetical protein CSA15_09605 [Candidatus Delongbacteria bacterium]
MKISTIIRDSIVVFGLIGLAFYIHHSIFYSNPDLDKTIKDLKSGNPTVIGEALLRASKLDMGKGYKLIPHILPLLNDKRRTPKNISNNRISNQNKTSLKEGNGSKRGTIGYSTAIAIQSMTIKDILHLEWVGGNAEDEITAYINRNINIKDIEAVNNALIAIMNVRRKETLPFLFRVLTIKSESIRLQAISSLEYYIKDKISSPFPWDPKDEITPKMLENLKACLNNSSPYIKKEAKKLLNLLEKR